MISELADEELTFVHPDDVELYNKWDSRAFELQVANHELLGHGTGKHFEEKEDGKKNFNPDKVLSFYHRIWRILKRCNLGDQPSYRQAHVSLVYCKASTTG